jgi:hypothetical protein
VAHGNALLLLVFAVPLAAADQQDPCTATSTVSDVRFALALKDHGATFREGEIVPLSLAFTSTAAKRYWADIRNYDRSGRLGTERYCVEPAAADPLASYFAYVGVMGGGLGGIRALDQTPLLAEAELNEWRTLAPGHYRVYAISYRVWRPPDRAEKTSSSRIPETVRSNAIEIEVLPADPQWQSEQLRAAVQALTAAASPDDAKRAARRLRFLNTKESTKELASRFWGLNEQQPTGWDLMFGLYASPYRQLAIDSMRAELAAPDHAITRDYLRTLVNLEITGDPAWDPPSFDPAQPKQAQAYFERRRAHTQELLKSEMEAVVAALPAKTGSARALTLNGLLESDAVDPSLARTLRPALAAAWADLPAQTQTELIQYRWPLIAGPEMLPVLRRIVAEPPPPARTQDAMVRDAALQHLCELDLSAGRRQILKEIVSGASEPSLAVVELLSAEERSLAAQAAVKRIGTGRARDLDYELVDRYADAGALAVVQAALEEHLGKWACAPQSAMLRYLLRVAPEEGVTDIRAVLQARENTGCFRFVLGEIGAGLPQAQQSAIEALDDPDPEVVLDAARALETWGTPDAEAVLWQRLERFHHEWEGRADELRYSPEYESPGPRGLTLEQTLVAAIGKGKSWLCPPDKLARLSRLVWTKSQKEQVDGWIKQWNQRPVVIGPAWFAEGKPRFSLYQYDQLTTDTLCEKIAQLPRGTQLRWQSLENASVSAADQEALYDHVRAAAAEHGIALEKFTQPESGK